MYSRCSYSNCRLEFNSQQHANDHYHEVHGALRYIVTNWKELKVDKIKHFINPLKFKQILIKCSHRNIEYLEIYKTKEHNGGFRMGRRCKDCHMINIPDLTNMAGNDLKESVRELGILVREWNHFRQWGF